MFYFKKKIDNKFVTKIFPLFVISINFLTVGGKKPKNLLYGDTFYQKSQAKWF